METKFENFKVYVGCGHSATIKISKDFYIVTIEFSNDDKHQLPIDLSLHPELTRETLLKIKEEYPNYEPVCETNRGKDWIQYHFKKVL